MKKTLTLLLLLWTIHNQASAQWANPTGILSTSNKVGIGTAAPLSLLHIASSGTLVDETAKNDPQSFIIQANTGGRNQTVGAQLEFSIPVNTDGTSPWGQARIITVAGNATNANAGGKMILGTRRYFDKLGTGPNFYFGNDIVIDATGNIGMGTLTPNAKLEVRGPVLSSGTYSNLDATDPVRGNLSYLVNSGQMIIGWNRNAGGGETDFISNQGLGGQGGFAFYNYDNSGVEKQLMWVQGNGNVGIGTSDPKGYKLAVNGSAIVTSMTVKLNSAWPDYVFKKGYQLPSLQEVKTYIDQHQHLPEVPSEQEIAKEGLNLGEMNKLLMKKVEELTLYLIEKDKKEKELESRIKKLEQQVKN